MRTLSFFTFDLLAKLSCSLAPWRGAGRIAAPRESNEAARTQTEPGLAIFIGRPAPVR